MLCQIFKAIGEELLDISDFVQTNIYIFIYIDIGKIAVFSRLLVASQQIFFIYMLETRYFFKESPPYALLTSKIS